MGRIGARRTGSWQGALKPPRGGHRTGSRTNRADEGATVEELIPIFMFMCIAGVLILRPISKKLGVLIEAFARERMVPHESPARGVDEAHLLRITAALERLNTRIDLIDDRIGFMEQLVDDRSSRRHRITG
jgi:hypothetical protein